MVFYPHVVRIMTALSYLFEANEHVHVIRSWQRKGDLQRSLNSSPVSSLHHGVGDSVAQWT